MVVVIVSDVVVGEKDVFIVFYVDCGFEFFCFGCVLVDVWVDELYDCVGEVVCGIVYFF